MKKVLLGLLSLTLIATTACKKTKDAPAFTKENVAGDYNMTKVVFKVGSAEQDMTSQAFDPCELDDIITLKVDLTFHSTDAGAECNGDYDGTWSIPASNKFEFMGDTYDVYQWDGTTLAVSESYDFGGNTGTMITYYKKK